MRAVLAILLIVLPNSAFAAERETGWLIAFYRDTFTQNIFPTAFVQEANKSFGKSSMFITCRDGNLVAGLTFANDFLITENVRNVDFRLGDESMTFALNIEDTGTLGKQFILAGPDMAKFSEKAGWIDTVAFRYQDKSGLFPMIGAAEVLEYMRTHCATD